MPAERALPAIVRTAGVHISRRQVRPFLVGHFLELCPGHFAHLFGVRTTEPLLMPAIFFRRIEAGGVFLI